MPHALAPLRVLSVITVALALSSLASAQSSAGTITGTVYDQSKSVVAQVAITAIRTATNVSQSATSNKDGLYSLPSLEPGTYRLTLEKHRLQEIGARARHARRRHHRRT